MIAVLVEGFGRERLREEIGHVVGSRHVRDNEALILDELAYVKVAALNVLHLFVVLGVVREVASAAVVGRELDRVLGGEAELVEEVGKIDGLLGRLTEGHDLGLARGEGDRVLLLRAPRDGREGVVEHVTVSGERRPASRILRHSDEAQVPMSS